MTTVIHWFRRDLRLADNLSLHAARQTKALVVPVYIFDPAIFKQPDLGAPRVAFLLECVESLRKNIEAAGGRLIVRRGDAWEQLRQIGVATGARTLYFNRDGEPATRQRDLEIEKMALAAGWEVKTFQDDVIHDGTEVLKADGKPYVVFTPYAKVWQRLPKPQPVPAVRFSEAVPLKITSEPLPTLAALGFTLTAEISRGGEKAGRELLKEFVARRIDGYQSNRDFPAIDGTSRLSPHLAVGTISARTVWTAAESARQVAKPAARGEIETFQKEIIWREFYRQVLGHFPHAATGCFRRDYDAVKWENNERYFAAWCAGKTGYPIVDAAMRQLNATGWMHNRLRMIVAMFLTKDLLINWQWGERYFMHKLVDADLASNNGGWQWSAGTGTDAAPYFRIFNPNSQAAKFDPEGRFIARYVPEADDLSYGAPIVDHAAQRIKALAMYKSALP